MWEAYYTSGFVKSQHPDLTVTSEEKVLQTVLSWCMQAKEWIGWEVLDELTKKSNIEKFGERLQSLNVLLPFVRFPLLPLPLLKKVRRVLDKNCTESTDIPTLHADMWQS